MSLPAFSCTRSIWRRDLASAPHHQRAKGEESDDIDPDEFDNGIDDDTFAKIVA